MGVSTLSGGGGLLGEVKVTGAFFGQKNKKTKKEEGPAQATEKILHIKQPHPIRIGLSSSWGKPTRRREQACVVTRHYRKRSVKWKPSLTFFESAWYLTIKSLGRTWGSKKFKMLASGLTRGGWIWCGHQKRERACVTGLRRLAHPRKCGHSGIQIQKVMQAKFNCRIPQKREEKKRRIWGKGPSAPFAVIGSHKDTTTRFVGVPEGGWSSRSRKLEGKTKTILEKNILLPSTTSRTDLRILWKEERRKTFKSIVHMRSRRSDSASPNGKSEKKNPRGHGRRQPAFVSP